MAEPRKVAPKIAAKERGPGPGRYLLPSLIGTDNVDQRVQIKPCYTFGTHLGSTLGRSTIGPGPAHFVPPKVTRQGTNEKPSYSMAGRAKDFKNAKTPGPGAYKPENVVKDKGSIAPVYTMRPKTKFRKSDNTPAANAYNVPTTMSKSKESPKRQNPIYSMTGRATKGGFAEDLAKAPAPGKYTVSHPDTTKNKNPLYSLRARTQMPQDSTKKPGPGAHRPENVTINKKKAPTYSMGSKHSDYLTPLIVDVPDY